MPGLVEVLGRFEYLAADVVFVCVLHREPEHPLFVADIPTKSERRRSEAAWKDPENFPSATLHQGVLTRQFLLPAVTPE